MTDTNLSIALPVSVQPLLSTDETGTYCTVRHSVKGQLTLAFKDDLTLSVKLQRILKIDTKLYVNDHLELLIPAPEPKVEVPKSHGTGCATVRTSRLDTDLSTERKKAAF